MPTQRPGEPFVLLLVLAQRANREGRQAQDSLAGMRFERADNQEPATPTASAVRRSPAELLVLLRHEVGSCGARCPGPTARAHQDDTPG
jgi:hypothetical protein